MGVNGQVQRVHGLYREQLQLALSAPKTVPKPGVIGRAKIAERLLLRTEEAINNQLITVRKLNPLAFAKLCRIHRQSGFQYNKEFNPSRFQSMRRLPTKEELKAAAAEIEKVVPNHFHSLGGVRFLTSQEKDAWAAKSYQGHIETLQELNSLFEAGKNKEFSELLALIKHQYESSFQGVLVEPHIRRIYLILSLDGVIEGAKRLAHPNLQ